MLKKYGKNFLQAALIIALFDYCDFHCFDHPVLALISGVVGGWLLGSLAVKASR